MPSCRRQPWRSRSSPYTCVMRSRPVEARGRGSSEQTNPRGLNRRRSVPLVPSLSLPIADAVVWLTHRQARRLGEAGRARDFRVRGSTRGTAPAPSKPTTASRPPRDRSVRLLSRNRPWNAARGRFLSHRPAVAGLIILLGFVVIAVLGPLVAPYGRARPRRSRDRRTVDGGAHRSGWRASGGDQQASPSHGRWRANHPYAHRHDRQSCVIPLFQVIGAWP